MTGVRLQVFRFHIDSKFSFLIQSYSDFDTVADGLYCIFDYYSVLSYITRWDACT